MEMTQGVLDREVLDLLYSKPENGGDTEKIIISAASRSQACIIFKSETGDWS